MSLFMKGDDDMEQQHLAIASVPMQNWETLYDWDQALATGTIFPGLNKPFFVLEENSFELSLIHI